MINYTSTQLTDVLQVRLVVAKIREAATAAPGTALDMTAILGGYASDFVCRAVLGESHRKQGRNKLFRELTEISASLLGGFNLEDYFPRLANIDIFLRLICAKAMGVSKRWDKLFNELFSEYARGDDDSKSQDDFVHLLLNQQQEYGLTTGNIKAILVVINSTYTTVILYFSQIKNVLPAADEFYLSVTEHV